MTARFRVAGVLHVPNARVQVSKVPDIRAIMGMQDVWVGSAVNACKACR
jgi:hypothetical protein